MRLRSEIPERVLDRATRNAVVDLATGCHTSTYSAGSHGYAQIGWWQAGKSMMTLAHRAAWIAKLGDIPEGMTVDHVCKNRRCVNVAHLRLLPNYENARRTSGRDWPLGQCANGHASTSPARRCIECNREQQARYRAKQRAKAAV